MVFLYSRSAFELVLVTKRAAPFSVCVLSIKSIGSETAFWPVFDEGKSLFVYIPERNNK